ncbi:MAG: GNAT family N-acetyltransferase [Bacteroidota bacterium]
MKELPEIRLRPLRVDDAFVTWNWRNHPMVREYFSGHGEEVTLVDEQDWVHRQLKSDQDGVTFCVEDALSGLLVGMTFLKKIDRRNRQAEFAILIDPSQSGKGYGIAACLATLREAFSSYTLHRVYLKVRTDNEAAIRLYDRCGFMKEGILRDDHFKNGRFYDQYIMSVLDQGK